MTKTEIRALKQQLRNLRTQRKDWRDGRTSLHWYGLPWCGPGWRGKCTDPACEGCAGVAFARWYLDRIEAEAAPLKAALTAEENGNTLPIPAADLSCQGLTLVDHGPGGDTFHGQPVEGYTAEMTRRGEGHVIACDLVGHLCTQ